MKIELPFKYGQILKTTVSFVLRVDQINLGQQLFEAYGGEKKVRKVQRYSTWNSPGSTTTQDKVYYEVKFPVGTLLFMDYFCIHKRGTMIQCALFNPKAQNFTHLKKWFDLKAVELATEEEVKTATQAKGHALLKRFKGDNFKMLQHLK